MALFMKQDFAPPILSRRWLAIKFRPNMLIYSRHHVIAILESGLMFREDSVEVEQETPSPEEVWAVAGGSMGGWLTRGEAIISGGLVTAALIAFPPKSFDRRALLNAGTYLAMPILVRSAHRSRCGGSLGALVSNMREYLSLARRAAACLKEYRALHTDTAGVASVLESTHALLCRQQAGAAVLMSRASSSLLGNAPWLRGDLAWDAVAFGDTDNLMKIHHGFLVVQSTLLKHIALAHFLPSQYARKIYRNHNERLYWLHNVLIRHLNDEFVQNRDSLERMYRLLKNSGCRDIDNKRLGSAVIDNWTYSEVHTGVARTCLELKLALNKCNSLDMFFDSCASNDHNLDLDVIDKDLESIIDGITKCLSTMQSSQLRLKKLRGKLVEDATRQDGVDVTETLTVLKIEDRAPVVEDEVFYYVKTDDDVVAVQPVADLTTAPGEKEKEATKIVLGELRRILGKRESVMRERERRALVRTMPELKDLPEFPRQINYDDYVKSKGCIAKYKRKSKRKKLFKTYSIAVNRNKNIKYLMLLRKYVNEDDIPDVTYEANAKTNFKSKLLTFEWLKIKTNRKNKILIIIKWCKLTKCLNLIKNVATTSRDVAAESENESVNDTDTDSFKVTKKDLEMTSSSDSESESLLRDVRKNRVVRRKNYPRNRVNYNGSDESCRPIEYSLGTGLAMASVLQINSNAKMPSMAQEEIFIGDGEVSNDSGNDEES